MKSLRYKWSLTLVITSLVGIVLVGLLATRINTTEYQRFRDQEFGMLLAEVAGEYFAETGHFEDIDGAMLGMAHQRKLFDKDRRQSPVPFIIVDVAGAVVSPSDAIGRGDVPSQQDVDNGTPIYVDDEYVGTVIITIPPKLEQEELQFLKRTNINLLIAATGAVVVAVILGGLLSSQFLRPLVELTDAIGSIKQGKFDQRVPVRTQDELGELAQAFNQMVEELQHVNQLRRQMTADIAHDLRTPLTVISGYLEGLRDGSLKPTQSRFDTLYQEAQLLKRLIDDLRTLSLADAGELNLTLQSVDPADLLHQVVSSFAPLADTQQVTLQVVVVGDVPLVMLDRDRMVQVLSNLVSNSLRFTPEGGRITLSAGRTDDGEGLALVVRDTGSGIAPEHVQNIFARFYRVSESREQDQNESGLGLAIAQSIVTAHGGRIFAESTLGQGTAIHIHMPYVNDVAHS
jgi:signal transduction histidine kinase